MEHLDTSPMTLHHDFNVPYVRDEIKILGQRYPLQDFHKLSNILLNFTQSGGL